MQTDSRRRRGWTIPPRAEHGRKFPRVSALSPPPPLRSGRDVHSQSLSEHGFPFALCSLLFLSFSQQRCCVCEAWGCAGPLPGVHILSWFWASPSCNSDGDSASTSSLTGHRWQRPHHGAPTPPATLLSHPECLLHWPLPHLTVAMLSSLRTVPQDSKGPATVPAGSSHPQEALREFFLADSMYGFIQMPALS